MVGIGGKAEQALHVSGETGGFPDEYPSCRDIFDPN